jgi:hypothetical protein
MPADRPSALLPAGRDTLPLNRSEHTYLAVDGIAGTVAQCYLLRLAVAPDAPPVTPEAVRRALRELLTAFPRLRAVVEPTWTSWRQRILPDDAAVDELLEVAHRVETGVDPHDAQALEAYHAHLLNEPLSLERGLPFRSRLLPHATEPVLFFSVHHVVCDGRSMMQMIGALLGALGGQPMTPQPLESPSMVPALLPARLADWPRAVLAGWRAGREDKRRLDAGRVVQLPGRPQPRFCRIGVRHHTLALDADALKRLAKANGASVNTLLLALTGSAFFAVAREAGTSRPDDTAVMRMSVDLRRYFPEGRAPSFGNYVASVLLADRASLPLAERLKALDAQVKAHLARFERRERLWPFVPAELVPLIGRKAYSALAALVKRRDALQPLSCHATTLGLVDGINPPGAPVQLAGFYPTVPNFSPLFGFIGLKGRYVVTVSWPAAEIERATIDRLIGHFDRTLAELAAAPAVVPVAAPAPAATPAVAPAAGTLPHAA